MAIYLGYVSIPDHFTNPPYIDLDALPEPNLASSDTLFSSKQLPNNLFKHTAILDNPEADDAMPDAVGNELLDYILKWHY